MTLGIWLGDLYIGIPTVLRIVFAVLFAACVVAGWLMIKNGGGVTPTLGGDQPANRNLCGASCPSHGWNCALRVGEHTDPVWHQCDHAGQPHGFYAEVKAA